MKTPTINLNQAINIAKRNPKNYKIIEGEGFTNVIRNITDKNGKNIARKQSFDKNGNLLGTDRRINDNYSIYSNPSSNIFGLQYFTTTKNPKAFMGYDLNRVYVETKPKNLSEIRAFLDSQAHNMK